MSSQTAAALDAWRNLLRFFFAEENYDRMHDACESVGLTPGLMRALLSMQPGQSQPMKSLSRRWRCDASYVTSLVDGLEQRGIVERQAHPADRRAKTVVLTAEGERVRDALLARLHEPPAGFVALSPDEQATLRDLLAKAAGPQKTG